MEAIETKAELAERKIMEDGYGIMRKNPVSYRSSVEDEEFEEEDVWFYGDSSGPTTMKKSKEFAGSSSSASSAWRISSTSRTIPRASHETEISQSQQSSAPVKVPDWSKIYGNDSSLASPRNGSCAYDGNNGYDHENHDDVDDGSHGKIIPPHEWLARKLAKSQISSFSVCEGMGRTLKGRDLSRVRNAVLSKTGFLE